MSNLQGQKIHRAYCMVMAPKDIYEPFNAAYEHLGLYSHIDKAMKAILEHSGQKSLDWKTGDPARGDNFIMKAVITKMLAPKNEFDHVCEKYWKYVYMIVYEQVQ